jgi:PAS domain-containing protein
MFQYSQIAERSPPTRTVVRPTPIRHATLVLDDGCRIVGCDEGVESLFGYRRRELIGMCASHLIPDVALAPDQGTPAWAQNCASLKFSRIVIEARHADGYRIPVMASLLQGADRTLLLRVRSID